MVAFSRYLGSPNILRAVVDAWKKKKEKEKKDLTSPPAVRSCRDFEKTFSRKERNGCLFAWRKNANRKISA